MKLTQACYNIELTLEEEKITTLVIENRKAMIDIVGDLITQSRGGDGEFVLSDNGKELKVDKTMDVIINPFDINLNNKKIQTALYKRLEEVANDYIQKKEELNSAIVNLLDEILEADTDTCYDFDFEFSWNDLFKLYNIRIVEDNESILELIVEYIKIVSCYLGIKIITFVGLDMFFNSDELDYIITQASYCKVNLLFISAWELNNSSKSNICIIDNDKCIIQK